MLFAAARYSGLLPALILLGIAAAESASAQESPRHSGSCWKRAETQADMTRCASEDARGAIERLEKLLGVLRRTLEPRAVPAFDRAQAAWLDYARSHCRWDGAAFDGGSMQSTVITGCLATITEQRISTLSPYLCGWPPESPDCEASRAFEKP